jgi:glycosyltransferase involved in cell wall biosynthesis
MLKISIITVVRNRVDAIEDTIKSVLTQDYGNVEYIVIDGDSGDGTMDVINKFSSQIDFILSEKDNSLYEAINKGIKNATGDIIGLLHADDLFKSKNVITKVSDLFNSDANIAVVYGDADYVNFENKIVRHYSSKYFRPFMFYFGFQPAHTASFIKKEFFDSFGFYREDMKIAGDFELLLRALLVYKLNYKYINLTTVNMRIGGVSNSGFKSIIKLNQEIFISLKSNKLFASYISIYSKYFLKIWSFLIPR